MAVNHFDLIVIGSGPAGERGAAHAAALGKRVALVEREPVLGGTVANLGTLPSKTMRETALHLAGFRQRGIQGVSVTVQEHLSAPDLLQRERLVRQLEQARIRSVIDQGRIDVYHGAAKFVDCHTVRVCSSGGVAQDELLSADKVLIATGSSPWRAEQFRVSDPRVMDSSGILKMAMLPKRLLIAGGGVIGAEYASIFSALGVKVCLVEEGSRLLPFLDAELSSSLQDCLAAGGVDLRLGQPIEKLECSADGISVHLNAGEEVLETDAVLVSSGRQGNTRELNLNAAGLEAEERGFIPVNGQGQTRVGSVYAAGDVRGFPGLASAAREQAVAAMRHAFEGETNGAAGGVSLYGIYTIPECSMAGDTEEALKAKGVAYVSGTAYYPANIRGQIIGARSGFLKLLFQKDTLLLLGVHIIGEQASELIHVGVAALQARAKARFFAEMSINYPTLSELYRVAALEAIAKSKPAKPTAGRLPGLRPTGA